MVIAVCSVFGCVAQRSGPLPVGPRLDEALSAPAVGSALVQPAVARPVQLPSVLIDPSNGLSPDEAALVAIAVNPALRAIRDNRGIAQSQVIQAGILPNPEISAGKDWPAFGATAGTQPARGAELAWDLTSLLPRRSAVTAERQNVEAVELDIAWQEWQVAQQARLSAGRLLFIERRLALAIASEQAFLAQVTLLRDAMNLGNATILTLSAAESAQQTASLNRLEVLQEQRNARLDLLRALGVPPTSNITVDPSSVMPSWERVSSLADLMTSLPTSRLDLQSLQRGYQSQDTRIRAARLRAVPSIGVVLRRGRDTSGVGTMGFSVVLGLPFFNRNQGEIALQSATQRQLYDEYQARVQSARFEVGSALINMTSLREQIELLTGAVNTLGHLLTVAAQQTGQGNVSLIDLYDLRVRQLTTQLSLQSLFQGMFELGVALDIAAGRIVADPVVASP
ncbi:MAG: hypothetical protein JWN04_1401 [Myxococcaceae bacterium]|nr:hypothetical protein [Myxococcaceae bacterium]